MRINITGTPDRVKLIQMNTNLCTRAKLGTYCNELTPTAVKKQSTHLNAKKNRLQLVNTVNSNKKNWKLSSVFFKYENALINNCFAIIEMCVDRTFITKFMCKQTIWFEYRHWIPTLRRHRIQMKIRQELQKKLRYIKKNYQNSYSSLTGYLSPAIWACITSTIIYAQES